MSRATNWSSIFSLPNPGLRAFFHRVVAGQPIVYRTPFYDGTDPQDLVSKWTAVLHGIASEWSTLWDFEIDLGEKVGPLSVMRPLSERLTDVDAYYDSILLESTPVSPIALSLVLDEWRQVSGLRIRSEDSTVGQMKLSTNSGSPFFKKRSMALAETLPINRVYMDGDELRQVIGGKEWTGAAVLGWRGQEGGPKSSDVKQRVVWMFPFAVNVCELRAYQPLIVAAQKQTLVPAWVSLDAVDSTMTSLFDSKGAGDLIVCTDFTKFDQHFNTSCQHAALYLLQHLFTPEQTSENWLSDVFPIKYSIPLAYKWEGVLTGPHGMGSGSGGTNVDETLLHRALQHEAAHQKNQTLNPHSQCLGDDGVLTYPGCEIEDVVRSYTAHGLVMNTSKQYASASDCRYLRRWYHKDYRMEGVCVGVYSTLRALGRLCYQERFYDHWSEKMVALRQLSILENVRNHPLRDEFATFCMKGDKFRLGLDIPGFLDQLEHWAQEATDYMPDFLGYSRSLSRKDGDGATGIQSWWIVQFLKSYR